MTDAEFAQVIKESKTIGEWREISRAANTIKQRLYLLNGAATAFVRHISFGG